MVPMRARGVESEFASDPTDLLEMLGARSPAHTSA